MEQDKCIEQDKWDFAACAECEHRETKHCKLCAKGYPCRVRKPRVICNTRISHSTI